MGVLFDFVDDQKVDFGTILGSIAIKTFVFTVDVTALQAFGGLFGKHNYPTTRGWAASFDNNGAIYFAHYWNNTNVSWKTGNSSLTAGSRFRVVLSYNRGSTSNIPLCWVNGVSKTMSLITAAATGSVSEGADPFVLGDFDGSTTTKSLDGELDDFRVYEGLATQAMVTADYSAYQAGNLEATSFDALTRHFWCLMRAAKDVAPEDFAGQVLASGNTFVDVVGCAVGTPAGDPVGV